MEEYYIFYKIKGFKDGFNDKQLKAGPYHVNDLSLHRRDIEGYEGVYNVSVKSKYEVGENEYN